MAPSRWWGHLWRWRTRRGSSYRGMEDLQENKVAILLLVGLEDIKRIGSSCLPRRCDALEKEWHRMSTSTSFWLGCSKTRPPKKREEEWRPVAWENRRCQHTKPPTLVHAKGNQYTDKARKGLVASCRRILKGKLLKRNWKYHDSEECLDPMAVCVCVCDF